MTDEHAAVRARVEAGDIPRAHDTTVNMAVLWCAYAGTWIGELIRAVYDAGHDDGESRRDVDPANAVRMSRTATAALVAEGRCPGCGGPTAVPHYCSVTPDLGYADVGGGRWRLPIVGVELDGGVIRFVGHVRGPVQANTAETQPAVIYGADGMEICRYDATGLPLWRDLGADDDLTVFFGFALTDVHNPPSITDLLRGSGADPGLAGGGQ